MTSIQKAIASATASVEMEGFTVTEQDKELCARLLKGEISKQEYIRIVLQYAREQSHAV